MILGQEHLGTAGELCEDEGFTGDGSRTRGQRAAREGEHEQRRFGCRHPGGLCDRPSKLEAGARQVPDAVRDDEVHGSAPVAISIVDHGVARDLSILPETFLLGPSVLKLAGQTIPISGFRLRGHINSRSVWDEFLVFQGASYFRAVGKGGQYGLSARGLALRTAHPSGEEFPAFTHFWIERPAHQCHRRRGACAAGKPIDHRRLSLLGHAGQRNHDGCGAHAVSRECRWTMWAWHRSPRCSCSMSPIAAASMTFAMKCTTPTACRSS